MIQAPENVDRGQYLYSKYPGAIEHMVKDRKGKWHQHSKFQGLRNNCRQMDAYIDNNSNSVSTFISDITPPVIRKAYFDYIALFSKFLETDPLFSVRRNNNISVQQEQAIQKVLSDNIEKTYFREKCLPWTIDHIVRYGTAITYTFATNDYNAGSLMTIKSPDDYGDYRQVTNAGDNVVMSTAIHPLNFIIDPRANFQVEPDFVGFIGDICVSNIATLMQNDIYIQKNLKEVFEDAKKGIADEYFFSGTGYGSEIKDLSKGHSNITYLWTRLPIKDNEDDPTWYAIEIIGDKIIRIEENILDGGVIPLAIQRILPRPYTYYGNSPLADKICIQNMMYWSVNTTVESTARLMDRFVLYREGSLDVEAINSRHQTGGFIPYKGQEPDLSRLIFSPQLPNQSFRENDWLMQEMRREDQDTSPMPNFNPQSEGGPTNRTLGGAQMMASIGELRTASLVNQMAVGLKDVAKHMIYLLRNISQNQISLSNGEQIGKDNLLGDISFTCKISNVFNYLREAIDSKNRLMDVINLKATKIPEFSSLRISQFIEDFVRNSVKRENIDDYVDGDMLRQLEDQSKQQAVAPPQPPMPQGAPVGAPTV